MQKSKSSSNIAEKVSVKPATIPIVNDPLGVNNDYDRLDKWNKVPCGEETNLNRNIKVSKCTSLLPTVNPYLAASVVYHEAAKPRIEELTSAIHSRTSVEESHLWSLVRDAENQARKMRKPKNEKNAGLTESQVYAKKMKKIPPSSTALKRRSLERSKEAMKNPLVGGVFTSYNDPVLVAERSKKKTKSISTESSAISTKSSHGNIATTTSVSQTPKQHQHDATKRLLIPTTAYEHHYDPDELHEHQDTVTEMVAKMEAKHMKPYMVQKRERTLTEFLTF